MTFSTLGRFRRRGTVAWIEAMICALSPALAIFLRGMSFSEPTSLYPMIVYVIASAAGGLAALHYVQISGSQSGFVSVVDLKKIFKAALAASIAGVIGTYFATHMQFVPRYVPVIQFFLFSGLLIAASLWRAKSRLLNKSREDQSYASAAILENQLLIGCSPLAIHYASLIDELPHLNRKIIGLVSITRDLVGTTMAGRIVLGPLPNIFEILNEFRNHGVAVNRIVISTSDHAEQKQALELLASYCNERGIELALLSDVIGGQEQTDKSKVSEKAIAATAEQGTHLKSATVPNAYLVARQRYEWMMALLIVVLASPLFLLVAGLAYFDVGRPVIFWQRRVGQFGRMMTIHKFRTLPHMGNDINDAARKASWLGRLLQISRLDEIPQIFDIFEGQLSFIGPRPLLPHDLPEQTGLREAVLPGITGWAQVHGGKDITADEKVALDNWYLRHASFSVDALILFKTARVALGLRERRDDRVIKVAIDEFHHRGVSGSPASIKAAPDADIASGMQDAYALNVANRPHAA